MVKPRVHETDHGITGEFLDARHLHFEDGTFDGAFSNGSLHEWAKPEQVMNEMFQGFLWLRTKPKVMRSSLLTSIESSYTSAELEKLIADAGLDGWAVTSYLLGSVVQVTKPV